MEQKYSQGFKIKLTGKTELLYGRLFDEAIYLEGPKKGKILHVKAQSQTETN